jgi:2OG-Fe(II) oxygenase superfamily
MPLVPKRETIGVAPRPHVADRDGGTLRFNLRRRVAADAPFRYATFRYCLSPATADRVLTWFETSAPWKHVTTDFYEQYEFSCWDTTDPVAELLRSDTLLSALRRELSDLFGRELRPDATVVAHRLLPGHRIEIHNDHLEDGETHRFVVQLNRGLRDADGGFFMLFNSRDPSDVHDILRPSSRSGFAFEISPDSYHAISQMHGNVRYSVVYSFFAAS